MLTELCRIYFSIFSFYSWGTNTQKAVFGRPSKGTQLQHHNYQGVPFQKSDKWFLPSPPSEIKIIASNNYHYPGYSAANSPGHLQLAYSSMHYFGDFM